MDFIRVGFYIYFHLGGGGIDDDDEAVHTLVFITSPKLENGGVRISLVNSQTAARLRLFR